MNYQSGPEEPKRIDELSPRAPLATDFIPICPANGPTYKASLKEIADLTPSPIPPVGPGNVNQVLSVGGGLSPEWVTLEPNPIPPIGPSNVGQVLTVGGGLTPEWVTASAGGGGGTVLPDGDAINSCLVWHVPTGAWVPARLVQEAQNIHSGGVGTIPYQIGEHKTAHLNIGTKGQILTVEQLAPTMFLPKWADAAAGLPVSSIADASKVLTVKADGTGADWVADAKELVRLISGIPAKVNLIPFNPWPGSPYECSDQTAIDAFVEVVNRAGYSSPVRTPRGRDIMAACGQLKSASQKVRASERAA